MTTESGSKLRNNNEKIVKLMSLLKQQRSEITYLIEKQEEEKKKLQTEIERLSFKLSLLLKSLSQRMQARANYDKTLKEIEAHYFNLVEDSGKLLFTITKEVGQLEEIMDKKTGTAEARADDKANKSAEESREDELDSPEMAQEDKAKQITKTQGRQPSVDLKKPSSKSQVVKGDKSLELEMQRSLEKTQSKSTEELTRSASNQQSTSKAVPKREESKEQETAEPYEGLAPKNPNDIPKVPPPKPLDQKKNDSKLLIYKAAYERQHKPASPPASIAGRF